MKLNLTLALSLPALLFSQIIGDCGPATSISLLDINNVSTPILQSGGMWWDGSSGQYEIPKSSGLKSAFAGGLWIGGIDDQGDLYMSAQTYRQTGDDFWPGAIDTVDITASSESCAASDRMFVINKFQVEEFKERFDDPNYEIPEEILSYPGNGNSDFNESHLLAEFVDLNLNGLYEPLNGEYPKFAEGCESGLKGDQCIFWITNDVGNNHTSSQADKAMGIEIHHLAFAYLSSLDYLNNTTFYEFNIINRSSQEYHDVYVAQFVDSDLGNYYDDFIGCDVARGIGYTYNGDENDEGSSGYGENPPAIGWDFVNAPLKDDDNLDNNMNGQIDEIGEKAQMSSFHHYYSDFTIISQPENLSDHYNYISGLFRDGTAMCYGGNAHPPSGTCYEDHFNYPFNYPGTSDQVTTDSLGQLMPEWSEVLLGNTPSDRSFLSSIGPFDLSPNDTIVLTGAMIWARAEEGGSVASREKLLLTSDSIQIFSDNCFERPCDKLREDFGIRDSLMEVSPYYWADYDSIHWDFGDGSTSIEDYPFHSYQDSGTYTICMYANNECDTVQICEEIIIEGGNYVGKEIEINSKVIVFPSPSNENIQFITLSDFDSFEIYDYSGSIVMKSSFKKNQKISINHLSTGIYSVVLRKEGLISTGRFVVD